MSKSIYFVLIGEQNGEKYFVMTEEPSLKENLKYFDQGTVRAVCAVELEENQKEMLDTLLEIDRVTNTCLVVDLIASIFTAGYHFGR